MPLYENEFRGTDHGALEFYASQNGMMGGSVTSDIMARAEGSMGNTMKFPVLKRNTTATVSATRACSGENNEVDSAMVGLNWIVVRDSFWMFPNRYMNNDIAMQEHFDANMIALINRCADKLEDYCLADLSANKTQVIADTLGYGFTSNSVDVPAANRETCLVDIAGMMRSNNYPGHLHIVGTYGVQNIVSHLHEHGVYNDVNRGIEYMGKTFHTSGRMSKGDGFAALYAVEEGQVGFVSRLSRAQYNNDKVLDKEWGSVVLPGTGVNFGIVRTVHTGDMTQYLDSSAADMKCDYGVEYVFEAEIAFLDKYNSDITAYANPIIMAEIA